MSHEQSTAAGSNGNIPEHWNALPAILIAFSEFPVISSHAILKTREKVPFVTSQLKSSFVNV